MKKSLIVILIIAILAIAAFIIFNISSKQSNVKLETSEDIVKMIENVYKNANVDLPSLETSAMDISDEGILTSFTGLKSNKNVKNLVVSVPLMTSQAYLLSAIKVDKNADIESMKQEIYDNIDMRMWICVSAEKLYITSYEDIIFVVMSSNEWAKPVFDSFKKIVNGKSGKVLDKTGEEEIELPPEM